MKTNRLLYFISAIVITGMLVSCGTSNSVTSSFGKRKYMKGYFFNNPANAEAVAKHEGKTEPATPSDLTNQSQTTPDNSIQQTTTVAVNTVKQSQQKQAEKPAKANASAIAKAVNSNTKPGNTTMQDNDITASYAPTPGLDVQADRGSYNTPAIVGFVCSLLGLLLFDNGFAVILLVFGVLFSAMGLKKTNHKIWAILGLIMGILGLVLWLNFFFIGSGHPFNLF